MTGNLGRALDQQISAGQRYRRVRSNRQLWPRSCDVPSDLFGDLPAVGGQHGGEDGVGDGKLVLASSKLTRRTNPAVADRLGGQGAQVRGVGHVASWGGDVLVVRQLHPFGVARLPFGHLTEGEFDLSRLLVESMPDAFAAVGVDDARGEHVLALEDEHRLRVARLADLDVPQVLTTDRLIAAEGPVDDPGFPDRAARRAGTGLHAAPPERSCRLRRYSPVARPASNAHCACSVRSRSKVARSRSTSATSAGTSAMTSHGSLDTQSTAALDSMYRALIGARSSGSAITAPPRERLGSHPTPAAPATPGPRQQSTCRPVRSGCTRTRGNRRDGPTRHPPGCSTSTSPAPCRAAAWRRGYARVGPRRGCARRTSAPSQRSSLRCSSGPPYGDRERVVVVLWGIPADQPVLRVGVGNIPVHPRPTAFQLVGDNHARFPLPVVDVLEAAVAGGLVEGGDHPARLVMAKRE